MFGLKLVFPSKVTDYYASKITGGSAYLDSKGKEDNSVTLVDNKLTRVILFVTLENGKYWTSPIELLPLTPDTEVIQDNIKQIAPIQIGEQND